MDDEYDEYDEYILREIAEEFAKVLPHEDIPSENEAGYWVDR